MKRKLLKTVYWLPVSLAISFAVSAQPPKKLPVRESNIYVKAAAGKDHISIRWAPADEWAWKYANQYGYVVERFTIMRDSVMLPSFEKRITKGIRPRAVNKWDSIIQLNDYAAVMAQALYGEEFDVEVRDRQGFANIVNKTDELKQRFAMSMYAADMSFEAAKYAALGFVDKGVKSNEKYLYRIYTLAPKDKLISDTALVYISLGERQPLPVPADIYADFGNKAVILNWDYELNKEYYSAYWIEKSADSGRTFHRITEMPVTRLNETPAGSKAGMLYIDTLESNETEYQYRITGVSLFGESGPYSAVSKGKSIDNIVGVPHITGIAVDEQGKMWLNWEFEDSLRSKVKEFLVSRAGTVNGSSAIIKSGLASDTKSMELDAAIPAGYLTVTAIDKNGFNKSSFPFLFQAEDSTAPAVPVGLTGIIDTSGIVTLQWDANTEQDLLGYKVYRTFVKDQEYTTLVDTVWRESVFKDTVSLKLLNRNVYYSVTALDKRFNQSDLAPGITVEKPDVIPPATPAFTDYAVSEEAVVVRWSNSSSEDVAAHRLYRKQSNADTARWILQQEFTDLKIQQYSDTAIVGNQTYSYTLVAVDGASLESAPAPPLTLNVPTKRTKDAFKRIEAAIDRDKRTITVAWQKTVPDAVQLELYRGEDKTPMNLYKVFTPDINGFVDTGLTVNTKYKYAIRAVYTDGKYSDFKTKEVIY